MAEKKLFCNGCGRMLKYENGILKEKNSGDTFQNGMERFSRFCFARTAMMKW